MPRHRNAKTWKDKSIREEERKAAAIKHLRQSLEREQNYGYQTMKLHEKRWKKMLTKIALPVIREGLLKAWHNYEKLLDVKDYSISLSMDELIFAEEQQLLSFRGAVKNIDQMVEIFQYKVDSLRTQFNENVQELRTVAKKHSGNFLITLFFFLMVFKINVNF